MLLGLVLVRIMPETNFSPAIEERQGLLKDFVCLFKLNLGFCERRTCVAGALSNHTMRGTCQ